MSAAKTALREAFRDLPELARELEAPKPKSVKRGALDAPEPVVWSLALDEIRDTGVELRPRLPFNGPLDFTGPERAFCAQPRRHSRLFWSPSRWTRSPLPMIPISCWRSPVSPTCPRLFEMVWRNSIDSALHPLID